MLLIKRALDTETEGIYLRTRTDSRLSFTPSLSAETKVREVLIKDMLFSDDVAITTHEERSLATDESLFSGMEGLWVNHKTDVIAQDSRSHPVISVDDYQLDVVYQFTFLVFSVTASPSLDAELSKRIEEADTTLARF